MDECRLGVVRSVARYPVKSLRGEWPQEIFLEARGVEGDRRYAVYGVDGKIGSGKTTRRFRRMPNLLEAQSWSDDGRTVVGLPDGTVVDVTDPALGPALSALVKESVEVCPESTVKHLDDAPVHLVTTSSLRWVSALRLGRDSDPARFRPNLVVETEGEDRIEDTWVGAGLRVATARLRILKRTVRCVMPAMAQANLPYLPSLMADLSEQADLCLGVYADVEQPGRVKIGDPVHLVE